MSRTDGAFAPEAIESLSARLRGPVLLPGSEAYEDGRSIYNAMIDKRPGAIVRCRDVADVVACVDFARERGVELAVYGGGHNGAGLALCDDGLVADLGPMNGVHVDTRSRAVRVGGGCTWGDVDHATHPFGLAVPSGIISTTGVGGLTLGGGHGYLTRRYGLTVDNLLAAEVVLADGRIVTASEDEHPDLFWALRGGGGNFGIVTSFLFRGRPVHTVYGGPIVWPITEAREALRWYRDFIREAPRELYGWFGFHRVPTGSPFPEELHGHHGCVVTWCYTGPLERAEEVFRPIRERSEPVLDMIGPMPYPKLQSMFDEIYYPPGLQWYWKADFVGDIGEDALDVHERFGTDLPTERSTMHLYPIDGAVHDVSPEDTAFRYRDVTWSRVIVGVDPEPDEAERITRWAQDYWRALHPYSAGGGYVNFMMEEGQDRVAAAYRENYERLVEVKTKYDPDNLFHVNQNIRPRAGAR
ncbi:MAG TPA: FAD-binding oxidoreductase [Candidatus Krumholzibacteria bacterium]|nr:FAD-binding oxidoreductase [Candidatus Krumholzibacteria bacterium]